MGLTAVILDGRRFEVDLSPESVNATTLGKVKTELGTEYVSPEGLEQLRIGQLEISCVEVIGQLLLVASAYNDGCHP